MRYYTGKKSGESRKQTRGKAQAVVEYFIGFVIAIAIVLWGFSNLGRIRNAGNRIFNRAVSEMEDPRWEIQI